MVKITPPLRARLLLGFSLALNAGLLASLIGSSILSPAKPTIYLPVSSPLSTLPASSVREPFRWSQIESVDYQAFIQNLRAIGCPEGTIRDIVQGKVATFYASQERELQISAGSTATGPAPARQVQDLHQERAALLASILPDTMPTTVGADAGRSLSTATTTAAARSTAQPSPMNGTNRVAASPAKEAAAPALAVPARASQDRPSVLPAAVVAADSGAPMNEAQQTVLNKLQQDFDTAVGDPGQNPADPAYRQRWQNAQSMADQQYRAFYGAQAFAEMQKRAYLQSLAQQTSVK